MFRSLLGPTSRVARLCMVGSVASAVAVSSGVVWQASYSAYSVTTNNPGNTWTTGNVALSDDDTGAAVFTATGLKQGSTGTKCIAVTSTGTLPASVKLYGTGYSTTNALASSINLTITQGTGGSFASCSGFTPLASGSAVYSGTLAGFSASTGWGNGVGSWTPTGTASDTRVFQITYTVDPAAPVTTQGGSAAITFTWESQNT